MQNYYIFKRLLLNRKCGKSMQIEIKSNYEENFGFCFKLPSDEQRNHTMPEFLQVLNHQNIKLPNNRIKNSWEKS